MSLSDKNELFAVVDTETTWDDKVMSVGVIIAEDVTYRAIDEYYGLITPECTEPAMYSEVLYDERTEISNESSRSNIIADIEQMFKKYGIQHIFAYNSNFDERHLPELKNYKWVDIMQTTMYRQYNPFIPKKSNCQSTGKLCSGYGVESILQMITGKEKWEVHNALCDCRDELFIIQQFCMPIENFIRNANKCREQKRREYMEFLAMNSSTLKKEM